MDPESRWVAQLRKRVTLIAGGLGAALAVFGAARGVESFVGVLSLGTGSSLIAAALYTRLAEFRESFVERLFEQGLVDVFDSRLQRFRNHSWPDLIDSAGEHFFVLGVANHGYMHSEEAKQSTRSAVVSALERGVKIEFLWLNPECAYAGERDREESRTTRRDIVDSIEWFWTLRSGLGDHLKENMHLLEHDKMPSCGLTWADDQLIVAHYIAGQNNQDAPGIILTTATVRRVRELWRRASHRRRPALAQAYMNTYAEVRVSAATLVESRVDHLKKKRFTFAAGPSEADLRGGSMEGTE